jgi:hypothetical protein
VTSLADRILEDALSLPDDERRDVAERLLKSVPGAEADHQGAWTSEAKRRADEVERGEGELLDLDEAIGELRADLRRIRKA